MKISVIHTREVDAGMSARWHALQRSNPALASPFFCPEFTLAVGEVCTDVRVAVLEEGGSIVGLLPYQSRWSIGAPVGRMLSDHHGMVCAPGTRWRWPDLLRAAGLSCWRFYNLCGEQAPSTSVKRHDSLALDLSRGFDAYKAGRHDEHPGTLRVYERKHRKLARTAPLRYVDDDRDPRTFATVLRLKFDQYRRTGAENVLELRWVRDLLERVRQHQLPHFSGRLAVLYAGDQLAAANLGLRSEEIWHGWLSVYEPALARFSPGLQQLMFTAEAAAGHGCRLLDLGRGDEAYKKLFADHPTPLAEGAFTRSTPAASLTLAAYRAARTLVDSPFGRRLKPVAHRARSV
jgi:CelD/BcsL family acetyltransferase involved in cellulose biosynthesis